MAGATSKSNHNWVVWHVGCKGCKQRALKNSIHKESWSWWKFEAEKVFWSSTVNAVLRDTHSMNPDVCSRWSTDHKPAVVRHSSFCLLLSAEPGENQIDVMLLHKSMHQSLFFCFRHNIKSVQVHNTPQTHVPSVWRPGGRMKEATEEAARAGGETGNEMTQGKKQELEAQEQTKVEMIWVCSNSFSFLLQWAWLSGRWEWKHTSHISSVTRMLFGEQPSLILKDQVQSLSVSAKKDASAEFSTLLILRSAS